MYNLKLSTRPEDKYLGDIATWERAEAALAEAGIKRIWKALAGDGAFYGPKIDITVSYAMNRKHQCATLQLDFQLPALFELYYFAEGEEGKRETPVMIHRAILGSVERMLANLLEHYKGKWPMWLSPRQAIVCPVSDESLPYAQEVREAQVAQYSYILVVGEEEAKTGHVSVFPHPDHKERFTMMMGVLLFLPYGKRDRDSTGNNTVMSMDSLLKHFKDEVEAFHATRISLQGQHVQETSMNSFLSCTSS